MPLHHSLRHDTIIMTIIVAVVSIMLPIVMHVPCGNTNNIIAVSMILSGYLHAVSISGLATPQRC